MICKQKNKENILKYIICKHQKNTHKGEEK